MPEIYSKCPQCRELQPVTGSRQGGNTGAGGFWEDVLIVRCAVCTAVLKTELVCEAAKEIALDPPGGHAAFWRKFQDRGLIEKDNPYERMFGPDAQQPNPQPLPCEGRGAGPVQGRGQPARITRRLEANQRTYAARAQERSVRRSKLPASAGVSQ